MQKYCNFIVMQKYAELTENATHGIKHKIYSLILNFNYKMEILDICVKVTVINNETINVISELNKASNFLQY